MWIGKTLLLPLKVKLCENHRQPPLLKERFFFYTALTGTEFKNFDVVRKNPEEVDILLCPQKPSERIYPFPVLDGF